MNKIDNPFLVYGYEGPEYFCDREKETETILSALLNGNNMTLMSPRRYGKTGLIRNVFHHLEKHNPETSSFYLDIYSTSCLSDFVLMLGKAVLGKLDTPLQKAEGFMAKIFRSSQITMSTDFVTGLPEFSLSFQPQYVEKTLEEIFAYISQAERSCFIAIDEFQQVREYPEKNVEALLRTYVQQTHNVHFIFAGSKLHMMSEMFNSPKHPFYRSTEKLHLDVLNEDVYYEFASSKFKMKNITLPREIFHSIYSLVDGVTWYVQAVMNRLYRLNECTVTELHLRSAINDIILSEEDDYKRLLHLLTANQSRLLRAIANEGIVKSPLAGDFMRKHQMKSASSIQRALQYLMDEEYLYHTDEGYIVYDRFFALWLKNM